MMNSIAIVGSSGAIGHTFTAKLAERHPNATVHAFSRNQPPHTTGNIVHHLIDYSQEASIEKAASIASEQSPIDVTIVATGILHEKNMMPEKSLRDLSATQLLRTFNVNTIVPALVAKHFIPKLSKKSQAIFAALSARVGSISDNKLGGWFSYRASKAALNMIIKNAAIETKRKNGNAIIVGLHPGTVQSDLSEPFLANVPENKLFTPEHSVEKLINVLQRLTPLESGKCFAWDGQEIEP